MKEIKDVVPLKHHQVSMMYNILRNRDYYYEKLTYLIKAEICYNKFTAAWDVISQANDVLRSVFLWENDRIPCQIIYVKKKIPVFFFHSEEEHYKYFGEQFRIDISQNAIIVSLISVEKSIYKMIIYTHHVVMDGWSHANLIEQFIRAYFDDDYCGWMWHQDSYKKYIEHYMNKCQKNKEYWEKYFATCSEINDVKTFTNNVYQYINYKESRGYFIDIVRIIGSRSITLSDLIYSIWGEVLSFYYKKPKVIYGVTLSGREMLDRSMQNLLGMLISTVPFYVDFSTVKDFLSLTQRIKYTKLQHMQHQEYDLYDVNQLITWDNAVVIQNYPIPKRHNNKMEIELLEHEYKNELKISLGIRVLDDNVFFDYSYDSLVFKKRDVMFFHQCLRKVFEKIKNGNDIWTLDIESFISYLL